MHESGEARVRGAPSASAAAAPAAAAAEQPGTRRVARLLSIAGHPVVVMPLAAAIAAPPEARVAALATAIGCAALVMVDIVRKVRRGEWAHVDASEPGERTEFNLRASFGLLVAAGVLAVAGVQAGIAIVVGLSGLVVLAGHVFRRMAKLSLHVAFAVFAAGLVWPDLAAALGILALATAIAWSRWALGRHVGRDLVLGGLVGAAAGIALHVLLVRLSS